VGSAITPAMSSLGTAASATPAAEGIGAAGGAAGFGSSAASAAAVPAAGGGASSGILDSIMGKVGGQGGGGGGGDLQMLGQLLSKSKHSGMSAGIPQPLNMQQGMQGYVNAGDPGQAEQEPMDINGFISQIMGKR